MIIGYGIRDRLDRALLKGYATADHPWTIAGKELATKTIWFTEYIGEAETAASGFPSSVGARVVPVRLGL